MRDGSLSYEDVLRIVELVKSTQFSEFRLKVGEIEVHLRRASGTAARDVLPSAAAPAPAAGGAQAAPAPGSPAAGRELAPGTVGVRSPMVGTFYRASSPGAAPFVEVGQRVAPDTTVCIIEVMKLMNTISAGVAGVVTEVLVANGASVEYDQILVAIRPDGAGT